MVSDTLVEDVSAFGRHWKFLPHVRKTSGTQVGKRSPRLKILEIPGGRGAIKNPLEQKILGVGGANQRVFHGGGIDILISGTTH